MRQVCASTALVSFLVASFSKVLMMSEAWHEQSSPVSRYGADLAHSAHAPAFVGSGWPAPAGLLTRRRDASVPEMSARPRRAAAIIVDFITLGKKVFCYRLGDVA